MRYVSFTFPNVWAYTNPGQTVPAWQDLGDVRVWSCHHLTEIEPDDVLFIHDVFDPTDYEKTFPKIKNQWPRHVFNDSWDAVCRSDLGFQCHTANITNLRYLKFLRQIPFQVTGEVTHCANFAINKYQLNRFLCLKLSQWFNIDCEYSWSGMIDQERNSKHLDLIQQALHTDSSWYTRDLYNHLTVPLQDYGPCWVAMPHDKPSLDRIVGLNPRLMGQLWHSGLEHKILHSAVSILTETDYDNFGMIFTEKTSFALAGLTFPIWLNCAGMPDLWKNYGFDIFDDVIDHSYQYETNFVKRFYLAFANNLPILTDRQVAANAKAKHLTRLLNNKQRLFETTALEQVVSSQIDSLEHNIKPLAQAWYHELLHRRSSVC